jgi:hypothetical protein
MPGLIQDSLFMTRKIWTETEVGELRRLYPETKTAELAARFGTSVRALYAKADALDIKKTPEFKAQLRRECGEQLVKHGDGTRFRPGHRTWNAGMKGLQMGGKATQFKKGNIPQTQVPVGTIVPDFDGYLKIKVADPGMWEYVHRKAWEEANGPIPKGHAVVFRDGDKTNCALENLELISRSQLMARNTIQNYSQPLKQVMRMRAGILKTINHRRRKHEQKSDDRNA